MLSKYVLQRVADYLIEAMMRTKPRKSPEWWAYCDAHNLIEQAQDRLVEDAIQEWEAFNAK